MPAEVQGSPPPPYLSSKSTTGPTDQPDGAPVVDSVVRAFQSLANDANYKLVSDVFYEVNFLKEQNNNLKAANRSILEDYRDFRNELEDQEKHFRHETETLEKQIEHRDQEISDLNRTKSQLSAAKDLLEAQFEEKVNELESLKGATADLQTDKATLEVKLAGIQDELVDLTAMNLRLAEEKQVLKSAVEEKSKEFESLVEKGAALEASLANKSKTVERLTEEKAGLIEDNKVIEATVVEKDATLQGLRDEKAVLVLQLSAKEEELSGVQELKSSLEALLADISQTKSKLETELMGATIRVDEQTMLVEKHIATAKAYSAEISSLKTAAEARTVELAGLKDELVVMTAAADEATMQNLDLQLRLADRTKTAANNATTIDMLGAEVSHLTQQVEETTTRIASLEKERQTLAAETDLAKENVETLDARVNVLTDKVKGLQVDLSATMSDLDDTRLELHNKTSRLAELDALRVPLQDEPEETLVEILDTIWTSIAGLVETQFRQDLDQSVLSDESCWTNLRQSEYLRPHARHIPLPQSNSPAAKQMRVAAILVIISRALHRYIFRPVYLTENGLGDDGLVQMLRAIAVNDPAREEHTRATLLAMLPEKQQSAAAKRVATVVREVSYAVQHLLNALQYETFCNGLEQACKLACVQWMRIQLARMKIEPYFGPPFDDYDWQVLPVPSLEGQIEVGSDEIMLVVWPTMCAVENGDLESITQGLVISKDQVRAAMDEVRGRGRHRPGTKRARTLSMPGRAVSVQAARPFSGHGDGGEMGGA